MKILHPKDRERVLAGHNRARRTGTPFQEEYRLVARDGSEVWVRGEAAPIVTGDGKPRQRAGMILDITDRKRHEGNLKRRGDASASCWRTQWRVSPRSRRRGAS